MERTRLVRLAAATLVIGLSTLVPLASGAAQQQGHPQHPSQGSHPAPQGGHPAAPQHASFGNWHASGSRPAPISHAPARPPASTAHVGPNGTYHGTARYRGTTHYSSGRTVNVTYVRNAGAYPGATWVFSNQGRWYNGYWHNYWSGASWVWFQGFYGFWFPLDGATVFVYEVAPGVCQYWDGAEWVAYYDPTTGYYCPY